MTFADGRKGTVPYVGPVELAFENRRCFVGAMLVGDETLLGETPMEALSPSSVAMDVRHG